MSSETTTPFAFRLATLTLELIERHGLSLETAYLEAARRVGRRDPSALRLARIALQNFAKADLLLKVHKLDNLPIRRRCAFRVAFALTLTGGEPGCTEVGLLSGRLRSLITRKNIEKVEQIISTLPLRDKIAVEHSFPPWIFEEVSRFLGLNEAKRLVEACDRRIIWLRVNELKIKINDAIKLFKKYKINFQEDKDFPEIFELTNVEEIPTAVQKMIERGLLVVQDKGSVAVAHALGISKRLLVLDAAAAPGMKTSMIQQLSENEAEVVAVDVSKRRLQEMRSLLSRLGVRNVQLVHSDSRRIRFSRSFDKVLLDAPCTNTGAIASDPALRLSLWKPPQLEKHTSLQLELLRNALEQLKPGGLLVYSTCSLLSKEGEFIVDRVARGSLSEEGVIGWPGYPGFKCSRKVRRLYPHVHRTTGFFISKMMKENNYSKD